LTHFPKSGKDLVEGFDGVNVLDVHQQFQIFPACGFGPVPGSGQHAVVVAKHELCVEFSLTARPQSDFGSGFGQVANEADFFPAFFLVADDLEFDSVV